jgi:hypothetical protein
MRRRKYGLCVVLRVWRSKTIALKRPPALLQAAARLPVNIKTHITLVLRVVALRDNPSPSKMGGCTSQHAVAVAPLEPQIPPVKMSLSPTAAVGAAGVEVKKPKTSQFDTYYDLRHGSSLPGGGCIYIQSGDPGDVDGECSERVVSTLLSSQEKMLASAWALWFAGYLIAVAGELLQQQTQGLRTAIVVRLGHRRFAALPTFGLGNLHRIVPSSHKQLRHRMPGSGAARMSGSLRAGP